jgi:hypothetical protein
VENSTANPSMSKSGISVATCGHVCVDTLGTEWEPGWCVEEEDEDEEKDEKGEKDDDDDDDDDEEEEEEEEAKKEEDEGEEKGVEEKAEEEVETLTLGMIPAAPS